MGLRFKLGHLVDFNSFSVNRALVRELEDYGVSLEIDYLTQSVTISTPIDLVIIKVDAYTSKAHVYRGRIYRTCSVEDTVINIENDTIRVECKRSLLKRMIKV